MHLSVLPSAQAAPQNRTRFGAFAVPVTGDWLLHAPLHQQSALLNARALQEIAAPAGPDVPEPVRRISQALDDAKSPPRPREGPPQPLCLTILPTRACNLRCSYCGFGASAPDWPMMDIHTAAKAVEWMARHVRSSGYKILDVQFFGGEPFYAGDVVEVAVHRARALAAELDLIPHFEALTNGVYSEERARWIGDYFDVVILSFDGYREVHDRQRANAGGRGTFDIVTRTAKIISRSPADLCLRVCVTADNVDSLPDTVHWFCQEFQPFAIDFEPLRSTPESDAAGLHPPDPYKFTRSFWKARRIAQRSGALAIYAAAACDSPRLSFCPIGSDALILSPDRQVNACYLLEKDWRVRGRDMHLGTWDGEKMRLDQAAVDQVRQNTANKPRCARCFCRWSCAGGCHVTHTPPDCSVDFEEFCIQTRLITALLLLDDIGAADRAEELLENASGLERLALHPDDRLLPWRMASD